jgi:hypothetical protein
MSEPRRKSKGAWYTGVRIGEARIPGPYTVGGASGSGGGGNASGETAGRQGCHPEKQMGNDRSTG